MDFVVKARGAKISPRSRQRVERKVVRLARLDARIHRIEVEVIEEPNRRVNGGHRVEASCRTARRTFRATATGTDLDAALDRVVERLERQLADDHGRRRSRLIAGANRVKSGEITTSEA